MEDATDQVEYLTKSIELMDKLVEAVKADEYTADDKSKLIESYSEWKEKLENIQIFIDLCLKGGKMWQKLMES